MSNPQPLNRIQPTPGTPKAITTNFSNLQNKGVCANSLYFQVLPGNLGDVYIGVRGMSKASNSGIIAILRPPTANHLPDLAWNNPGQPNPFDIDQYVVDADTSGDGVRVSYTTY